MKKLFIYLFVLLTIFYYRASANKFELADAVNKGKFTGFSKNWYKVKNNGIGIGQIVVNAYNFQKAETLARIKMAKQALIGKISDQPKSNIFTVLKRDIIENFAPLIQTEEFSKVAPFGTKWKYCFRYNVDDKALLNRITQHKEFLKLFGTRKIAIFIPKDIPKNTRDALEIFSSSLSRILLIHNFRVSQRIVTQQKIKKIERACNIPNHETLLNLSLKEQTEFAILLDYKKKPSPYIILKMFNLISGESYSTFSHRIKSSLKEEGIKLGKQLVRTLIYELSVKLNEYEYFFVIYTQKANYISKVKKILQNKLANLFKVTLLQNIKNCLVFNIKISCLERDLKKAKNLLLPEKLLDILSEGTNYHFVVTSRIGNELVVTVSSL